MTNVTLHSIDLCMGCMTHSYHITALPTTSLHFWCNVIIKYILLMVSLYDSKL